jgi:hypothetical protein
VTRRKALGSAISALTVIPIAFSSTCFAEESISWSMADNGLRLGLSKKQLSTSVNLRVLLNNVSSSDLSVLVGMHGGHGDMSYLFAFTAVAPDGTRYQIWDSRPEALRPAAGLIVPIVIGLAAGVTREFTFSLKQLVHWTKGKEITLDDLLQQGHVLNVSFEVQQKHLDGAAMGGISPPSTGHLWKGRLLCRFRVKAIA